MKKICITSSILFALLILLSAGCQNGEDFSAYQQIIELEFEGPQVQPSAVYVAWIEDESGANLQNLYICNRVLGINGNLLGTALPYWQTQKKEGSNLDGVSGASVQQELTIRRGLAIDSTSAIRVGFEIDRSRNSNTYFSDRPAFIYKSPLIDLHNLQESYTLELTGFMANETLSGHYSQAPLTEAAVPGFDSFFFIENLEYIAPVDDMVSSLTVRIIEQEAD